MGECVGHGRYCVCGVRARRPALTDRLQRATYAAIFLDKGVFTVALNIILHTFRMIFGNLGQALRVSVGPYLLMIVLVTLAFAMVGMPMSGAMDPMAQMMSPAVGLLPLLLLPLVMFVTSWVAVSWHRFILLEEYSGILPAVSGRPIWSYAGKAILLGLLVMVVALPIFLILGTIMMPFAGAGGMPADPSAGLPLAGLLVFALATVVLTFLSLRWGVALVGTALGKPIGFSDAWRATKPISGVIFGVAAILMLINTLPGFILTPITQAVPIIGTVLQLMLTWLTMMLGISILTTLYGHVIEERPLVP